MEKDKPPVPAPAPQPDSQQQKDENVSKTEEEKKQLEHEKAVEEEKLKLAEEEKKKAEEKEKAAKPLAPKPISFKKTPGLRPDKALLKKSIDENNLTKEEWLQFQNEFAEVGKEMSEGVIVQKYGLSTRFFPDERKIFFIDRYRKLTWSKVDKTEYEKTFPIGQIEEVKLGKQTDNFKRFGGPVDDRCMSLKVIDRTIDLEFKNKEERDKFHRGVILLVKMNHRFEKNPYIYQFIDENFDMEVFNLPKPEEEKKGFFSFFK